MVYHWSRNEAFPFAQSQILSEFISDRLMALEIISFRNFSGMLRMNSNADLSFKTNQNRGSADMAASTETSR